MPGNVRNGAGFLVPRNDGYSWDRFLLSSEWQKLSRFFVPQNDRNDWNTGLLRPPGGFLSSFHEDSPFSSQWRNKAFFDSISSSHCFLQSLFLSCSLVMVSLHFWYELGQVYFSCFSVFFWDMYTSGYFGAHMDSEERNFTSMMHYVLSYDHWHPQFLSRYHWFRWRYFFSCLRLFRSHFDSLSSSSMG